MIVVHFINEIIGIFVVEVILRVRPYPILFLKLFISNLFADIFDDTGCILILLTHQAVLLDTPRIEVIIQFTRLGIRQL